MKECSIIFEEKLDIEDNKELIALFIKENRMVKLSKAAEGADYRAEQISPRPLARVLV